MHQTAPRTCRSGGRSRSADLGAWQAPRGTGSSPMEELGSLLLPAGALGERPPRLPPATLRDGGTFLRCHWQRTGAREWSGTRRRSPAQWELLARFRTRRWCPIGQASIPESLGKVIRCLPWPGKQLSRGISGVTQKGGGGQGRWGRAPDRHAPCLPSLRPIRSQPRTRPASRPGAPPLHLSEGLVRGSHPKWWWWGCWDSASRACGAASGKSKNRGAGATLGHDYPVFLCSRSGKWPSPGASCPLTGWASSTVGLALLLS